MQPSELRRVAQMNRRLQEDEKSKLMTVDQIEARLQGWVASDVYRALLFESNSEVVGYLLHAPKPDENGAIYVRQFFVEREHRRRGFGRVAFGLFREKYKEVGPIELDVFITNAAGHGFWGSMGFKTRYHRMRLSEADS